MATSESCPIDIPNFKILEPAGEGGLSSVYLAEQLHPHRNVIVKVVAPDAVRVSSPEIKKKIFDRLRREGDIAAMFQHPNLVTIFECGMIDEHYYIAMEYLSGGNLRSRMNRSFRMTDAIAVISKVCAGLGEMHRHGLLHRDLKPENIMFRESGDPVLVDFGIAKDLRHSSILTELGVSSGTPHYMSPEHLSAAPMDARSDLYAVGVLLFEMLSGDVPFDGNTALAISRAHMEDPIPKLPLKAEQYQPIIDKLLAKKPDDRYASADELINALRRQRSTDTSVSTSGWNIPTAPIVGSSDAKPGMNRRMVAGAVGAAAIFLVAVGLFIANQSPQTAEPLAPSEQTEPSEVTVASTISSVAVLPFSNLSNDPENDYFSDGVSGEILNALAQVEGLRVAARTSSFQFKDASRSISDVANELQVRHVLDGTVRKQGDRIRIAAELVDAETGYQLWSQTFDRQLNDVFAVQDEIAQSVADAIAPALLGAKGPDRSPDTIEAYDLYLLARHHFLKRNQASLERARGFFFRAIEQDPDFALAHVGFAESTILLLDSPTTYGNLPISEVNDIAGKSLGTAFALAPGLAEVHAARGLLRIINGDYERAVVHLSDAISLNPNYAVAYMWRGTTEGFLARFERCLRDLERAQSIDPLSPAILSNLIWASHLAGSTADTDAYIRDAFQTYPEYLLAWGNAGNVRYMQGRLPEARDLYHQAYEKSASYRLARNMLGIIELDQGNIEAASAFLTDATQAWIMVVEGRTEEAWQLIQSDLTANHDLFTYVAAAAGQHQDIIDLMDRLTGDAPQLPGSLMVGSGISNLGRLPALTIALALQETGDMDRADVILHRAARIIANGRSSGAKTPGLYYAQAVLDALQGQSDDAIANLEEAVEFGWHSWWYMANDPRLADIRNDARYAVLLERITPSAQLSRFAPYATADPKHP